MSMNELLGQRLEEIATLMDLLGEDSFRAAAHARAARAVAALPNDIASLAADRNALLQIEGIGPKMADKIIEFCNTGRMHDHAELLAKVPAGLLQLTEIPGLGPKTIRVMWQSGGITDLASLQRAIDDGSLAKLPRMGAKSVEKIRHSIANLATDHAQRVHIGLVWPVATRIVEYLAAIAGPGSSVQFAGSLRRGKETIGDIDILAATDDPARADAVSEAFRTIDGVLSVVAAGHTKSSIRIPVGLSLGRWRSADEGAPADSGMQVDLRVVPPASWGAALLYFTGSKEHNVALRERARKHSLTLNEYGLFPLDDEDTPPQARGIKPVAAATENDVYNALGLHFIPPEMREDRGEIELAIATDSRDSIMHNLVDLADIKAELHAHTTASDGRMSIEELAEEARRRGFHTIAVTDHSRSSAVAGGLSIDRLREHVDNIRAAASKARGITILAGSEVDILADGSLDYPDDLLESLDVVVASPHTALSQEPAVATARLLRAIANPYVHILGHPTGRLINKRRGLEPDMQRLIAAAIEHNVALEINTHWMRLDLRDVHARAAADAGCLIAIDSDVHERIDYDNLKFGVMTARRAWVRRDHCINAWPPKKLHAWLRSKGRR